MREAIISKIEQRRARLAELERERLTLEGELRAYEDALHMFPGDSVPQEGPDHGPARPLLLRSRPPKGRRRLSGVWVQAITETAIRLGGEFSIDDVLQAMSMLGNQASRGNVRSQMAAYVDRGVLERVGLGRYHVTDAGIQELRLTPDRLRTDQEAFAPNAGVSFNPETQDDGV